jgi:hypothetical protein
LIVAIGLRRDYAESLAERLENLPRLSHPHAITMVPKTTHVHETMLNHRVGFVLIDRGGRQVVGGGMDGGGLRKQHGHRCSTTPR